MDFNGNIRLLGGSTLRNARIERLADDPVSPLDGQLWYNTTDNVYRGFDGTVVMTFASGGNTALIQTKLDNTQTAAGFNADGTLTAFSGSNYLVSSESLRDALVALDTQLKSASDAAAQAQTEVDAVETALAAEASTRGTADAALQTELDATQVGAGLAADGTLAAFTGSNYVSAAESLRAAVVALDTQAKANADAVAAANTRLTDSMYLYTSGASADTHVVTHNLGQQFTQVTVIDSTNQVIIPDSVTFDSANQLTVVFSSATDCKVVVSAPKIA